MQRSQRFGGTSWEAPFGLAGLTWQSGHARARLLLQHGYAEHSGRYVEHYNCIVPRLVEAGIDVFAFDMAGHGLSAGERGITDIRKMVAAHLSARVSLAKSGLPLFLFGHSLGGLVTAASVARAPDEIAGVMLSAPALPPPAGLISRSIGYLMSALVPARALGAPGDPTGISHLDAEVEAYLNDPLNFHRPFPVRLGVTAQAEATRMWPLLQGWKAPTIIVHGTSDTYTSPKGSESLLAAIPSSDKSLHLVDGGRHELLNDLSRDEILSLLLDWIEERLSTRLLQRKHFPGVRSVQ